MQKRRILPPQSPLGRGGLGCHPPPPPFLMPVKESTGGVLRRGSILPVDVWCNKHPASARGKRRPRLIKRGVRERKLNINNKIGGGGNMHPAARLGAGLALLPPAAGGASSAAAASGACARAAVPCQGGASLAGAASRCQGKGKAGGDDGDDTRRKERKHLLPPPPPPKTRRGFGGERCRSTPWTPRHRGPAAPGGGGGGDDDCNGEAAAGPRFHRGPNSSAGVITPRLLSPGGTAALHRRSHPWGAAGRPPAAGRCWRWHYAPARTAARLYTLSYIATGKSAFKTIGNQA